MSFHKRYLKKPATLLFCNDIIQRYKGNAIACSKAPQSAAFDIWSALMLNT